MSTTTSEEAIQPAAAFFDFVFSWVGQVQKRGRGLVHSKSIFEKEESPYKPEDFDSRSFRAIAHGIAHKDLFYLIIFRNPVSPL